MNQFVLTARILLGLVFAISAFSKARNGNAWREFAASVAAVRLLPRGWAGPVSILVVVAEFAVPALLLATPTVPAGFALATVLLAAFTATVLAVIRRGQRQFCRCFGASTAPLGWPHVARNVGLGLVGAVALAATIVTAPATDVHLPTAALAAGVAAVLAVLTASLDDLIALFR